MPLEHDGRDDPPAAAIEVRGANAGAPEQPLPGKHEYTRALDSSRPLQGDTSRRRRSGHAQDEDAVRNAFSGSEQHAKSTRVAGGKAPSSSKLLPSQLNLRLRQNQKRQQSARATPSPDQPLSDYSQKLAREMSARVEQTSPTAASFSKRPSLKDEQRTNIPADSSSPSLPVLPSADSGKTTASSDSNRTIIASSSGNASSSARTPSYPFPPMVSSTKAASGVSSPGAFAPGSQQTTKPASAASRAALKEAKRPRPPPQRDESSLSFRSDQVQPSPSTPASAAAFLPSTAADEVVDGGRRCRLDTNGLGDLPAPNLYELALALSSEPGLDAWWDTVVEIATQWYKAERIALAIPSDTTDVENMPWGQKATFNAHEKEDTLSMGYMGKESNLSASTTDAPAVATPSDVLSPYPTPVPVLAATDATHRPSLSSRYSFTTYEDRREQKAHEPTALGQPAHASPLRPSWTRSHTSHPAPTQRSDVLKPDAPHNMLSPKLFSNLNQAALKEHDAVESPQDAIRVFDEALRPHSETQGRVLPVLQALDYEADPLIDHNGVQRVLDRGHVVALTRSYPYADLKKDAAAAARESVSSSAGARPRAASVKKPLQGDAPVNMPSILGGAASNAAKTAVRPSVTFMRKLTSASVASKIEQASIPRPKSPLYDEYEQQPPSPWAQSPAPSPAIRHDTGESPFFGDACVDEDSFNPPTPPHDYKETRPYEAIGVDNAWTVLHIPLYRPLPSSKASHAFKLDKSKMERRASPKRKPLHAEAEEGPSGVRASSIAPRQMPIAILSILSPVIPYPSNLRYSLEHLAPHMATSFSLCQHYSNLEAEVQGLTRCRRLGLGGFGGVDADDCPLSTTPSALSKTPNPSSDEATLFRSAAGSLASFSDHSVHARSIAGSPSAAPFWDSSASASILLDRERRANVASGISPGLSSLAGDGYFGVRPSSRDEAFGYPLATPGSSGGGGGGSMQRGRKGSVVAGTPGERRLAPLRSSELAPSSQVNTQMMGLETVTAAAFAPSSPSQHLGANDSAPAARQKALGETAPVPRGAENAEWTAGREPTENGPPTHEERMSSSKSSQMVSTPDGDHHPHGEDDEQGHNSHNHGQGRSRAHSQLHSYGADFATTFPSLPPSGTIAGSGAGADLALGGHMPSRPASISSPNPATMPQPSDKLKGLILDSLPAHVFVAEPQTGAIVWVNSRYLAYRGKTVESLAEDPWGSIHPDDLEDYLAAWRHSVRSGEQFSRTVRIRRFDGAYRWFQARAIASRDRRNTIVQFLGSYMDIHDQHIAELKAARKEEIEESELKHRILANLIPQIIFTANEEEGITFANEQWLLYTGQSYKDLLGLGFLDFLHPDDLAKCCFLPVPPHLQERRKRILQAVMSHQAARGGNGEGSVHYRGQAFRTSAPRSGGTGGGTGGGDEELSELAEMARRGIVMVTTDDNGRPSYTTEARLRSKTGEYRWHLIRCVETGTMDFGKGYNSYFGSATDINDHKKLEKELKEAMESKTRFLSNMSHEIRTPLIGISGMVSFLQDTTLNEEQRDYTNTIQTSANSLLMIINDILDLSKVDAGMMKLNFEWFHMRSLIEEVNELVSTMAIAKGLELNYIVDAEVPAWIKGDRVRIRQVLLNVIGNAIKFTSEGEIFSRCRVVAPPAAAKADEITLEFSVIDTGRGFTKEEAELIFKPFSQIDGSSTRQHGGSGLGLVISRQLVELHGGTMDGTAVPGEGSTFTFTACFGLPTEADHPDGLATPTAETNTVSSVTLTAMGLSVPSFMDHAAVMAAAAASAAGVGAAGVTRAPSTGRRGETARPNEKAALVSATTATTATTATEGTGETADTTAKNNVRPTPRRAETTENRAESKPVFSILIICPQTHSREATKTHIETTLPKDVPYRITVVATAAEAQTLIGAAKHAECLTHVVVNLPSPHEILALLDQLDRSALLSSTTVLILSDSVQRQAVSKLAADTQAERLLAGARVTYIYKPVKPSRFAVIFDPAKERDISIDRNRSSAQQLVQTQKQSYVDLEKRMGHRGYKVLLVEDNMVNQKVLMKYLHKVGVDVDVAVDGVACTDTVLSRPHDYYSLILCDLHMPRKDGYQACQEIRAWEKAGGHAKPIPIIALSANVMLDVHDKCVEAGFNKYITKPVDFVVLSRALAEFF